MLIISKCLLCAKFYHTVHSWEVGICIPNIADINNDEETEAHKLITFPRAVRRQTDTKTYLGVPV